MTATRVACEKQSIETVYCFRSRLPNQNPRRRNQSPSIQQWKLSVKDLLDRSNKKVTSGDIQQQQNGRKTLNDKLLGTMRLDSRECCEQFNNGDKNRRKKKQEEYINFTCSNNVPTSTEPTA